MSAFFVVQSIVRPPPYILDRINNFTRTFYARGVLNRAVFNQGLTALKAILGAESKNIQEQVNRLWVPIHSEQYNFDWRETLLRTAEQVSHAQYVDFYNTYVLGKPGGEGGQTTVRELIVGAFSGDIPTASFDVPRQVKDEDQYESVREFKKSAEYWD